MYDAAVAFADRCVGDVLARLDASQPLARTAVLVTSDHGEELLERWRPAADRPAPLPYYYRGYGHGHTMYDEVIHVPLLVKRPKSALAGERRDELVSLIDVAPTILELVDVDVPDDVRGRSLFAERSWERPIFTERTL